jgi:hypothetical protein
MHLFITVLRVPHNSFFSRRAAAKMLQKKYKDAVRSDARLTLRFLCASLAHLAGQTIPSWRPKRYNSASAEISVHTVCPVAVRINSPCGNVQLEDCDLSLKLNSSYVKAITRRAECLIQVSRRIWEVFGAACGALLWGWGWGWGARGGGGGGGRGGGHCFVELLGEQRAARSLMF